MLAVSRAQADVGMEADMVENHDTTAGMMNVIAAISTHECKTEAAASAGEIPDAFTEEDGLRAKQVELGDQDDGRVRSHRGSSTR